MNGKIVFMERARMGVFMRWVVRHFFVYDPSYDWFELRVPSFSGVRRAGRLLLAACKDDSIVYDWFLGPHRREHYRLWAMPITLTGGPAHGRVLRMQLRTGDMLHIPMPGKAMNSYGVITGAQMRKANYRINRDLRKAFYIGTTE